MFIFPTGIFIAACFIIFAMLLSIRLRKLTVPAAITGGILGMIILAGAGANGIAMLGTFFIAGTLATSFKKEYKRTINPSASTDTGRKAGQVLANGGTAAIMAALALADLQHGPVYILMLASSLAAATADSLSSELGMIYGKRFFNILTWKKEQKGLDGVISAEGTIIGILGAAAIALLFGISYGFNGSVFIIILAGITGNLADSILGAALERKHYIGNDLVNFLNTLVAAAAALAFYALT